MKNLVIVESPTKARTIGKFLGKDYEIKASMGHVMDLPKSKLSVDIENNFKPDFNLIADKKKIIAELKKFAKDAQNIFLATDPDREGEAIAADIRSLLSEKANFKRIVFHEITKEAIEEALKHPRDIDKNLASAQTARRVLDRLVGYKISPLLWKKVRRGLSAGRVQSVALRLIAEREREIEKFKSEEYYSTHLFVNKEAKDVEFILSEIDGKKIEKQESFDLYDGKYIITKTTIGTKQEAEKVVADLNKTNISVSDVSKKESKRSPIPPSTTSTLQQEASRRFGYSGKRTMSLAQKLYEEGFITYHRTDSVAISQSAIFAFRGFIEKEYGKNYLPEFARFYKTKQKLAQEAHEAIRPTKVNSAPSAIAGQMGADYAKLYDIIWRRAVSSQMADARIESTLVIAETDTKKYLLKANGSALVFDGFLKINPQALKDNILPEFKAGEKLDPKKIEDKSHSTTSPPRYNDASIIATLEEKGIGRPSTYASIIDTITTRGYVEREEGRFKPTSVGLAVNDFLVKNFSTIDDLPFTAEMEDMLDKVAQGEAEWQPVIKAFYTPFNASLEKAEDTERVKIEAEEIDELCPLCSSKLVIRTGRFGKFISCSTFPNCKFTKPLIEETNFICSKDGGKVIIKKTRKGKKFYGCGNYPKCDFAVWKLEDIKKEQSSRKA